MTWPRGNSTLSNVWARASAAAGSTPWKMPALARTSSTSCLLSHATSAQLTGGPADHVGADPIFGGRGRANPREFALLRARSGGRALSGVLLHLCYAVDHATRCHAC